MGQNQNKLALSNCKQLQTIQQMIDACSMQASEQRHHFHWNIDEFSARRFQNNITLSQHIKHLTIDL